MEQPSQELGELVRDFAPGKSNIFAGFILSLLALASGIAAVFFSLRGAYQENWKLPFNADVGWCWMAVGIANLVGVVLLFVAWLLFITTLHLMTRSLRVYQDGFQVELDGKNILLPWKRIAAIVETTIYERPPILKGPAKLLVPKCASKRYTIMQTETKDEIVFDGDSVKQIAELGEMLRAIATKCAIPLTHSEEHN